METYGILQNLPKIYKHLNDKHLNDTLENVQRTEMMKNILKALIICDIDVIFTL